MEKFSICFHRCTSYEYFYYLFNFSNDNEEDEEEEEDYRYRILHGPYGLGRTVLPPLLESEKQDSVDCHCSLAALGSKVYNTDSPVRRFDTSKPEEGWQEVAPPADKINYGDSVAVGNKIYVMVHGKKYQYFDPESNSWSLMSQPPSHVERYKYWSVLEDGKTILFTVDADGKYQNMLYGYNAETDTWVLFDENFEEKAYDLLRHVAVGVNRCMYWNEERGVKCYDLDEKAFYFGRFEYLDLELRGIVRHPGDFFNYDFSMHYSAKLTSLGCGKFCMLWQHDQLAGPYTDPLVDPNVIDSAFCCIYAIKFQASKVIGRSKDGQPERTLKLSIESSKSFLVKKPKLHLGNVLVVDGSSISTSTEETTEKKRKKPMFRRDSRPSPSIEKSICFRTINRKGMSNFYMFSFSYDEDVKAIDDHHYQIIHGPYGFGRALLHPLVSGFKKNRESYREDLSCSKCHREYGTLPLLIEYTTRRESNCAALGSTVYCFGGYVKTKKVHCFDIRNPGDGQVKEVPSMIKHRFHPHIHTSEGKIYVMGGLHENDTSEPWMEMFDPQVNEWIGLASNPYINVTAGSLFISALFDSKTFLVFHRGKPDMHAYDIATDSWHVYDARFDYDNYPIVLNAARYPKTKDKRYNLMDYPVYSKAVAFEKTWYQYDCNDGIVAYDMEEKKWFRGEFLRSHLELRGLLSQPLESQLLCNFDPILLHVGGGNLCLLWQDKRCCGPYTDDPGSAYTCVYWIKFRVTKLIGFDGEGVLKINIDSSKSFLISKSMALRSAIVM
ncbi:hypothetical protein V6N13_145595 [Hibiscus sabdariffa]|uniref:FKB95-like N-terminal Kelch domain-containing protein n=1 Tax=Hibiscus sabdariffa TaxID=183260 RepID=A0ABR2TQ99_9ROSI